jgi:hypothetical protein
MKAALDIWNIHKDLDVIFGDICSTVCLPVSQLASVWNIPMISYGCNTMAFNEKNTYNTFSRVTGRVQSEAFYEVIKTFGWKRVGLLSGRYEANIAACKMLLFLLRAQNISSFYYRTRSKKGDKANEIDMSHLYSVMKTIKNEVRVIVLFCYDNDFLIIMKMAHDLGMLQGNFVFFSSDSHDFVIDNPLLHCLIITQLSIQPTNGSWYRFAADLVKGFDVPAFVANSSTEEPSSHTNVSNHASKYILVILITQINIHFFVIFGTAYSA